METPDWDADLLAAHREHLASNHAREAFDLLVERARYLPRYSCGPRWHGAMRTFAYLDVALSNDALPTVYTELPAPTEATFFTTEWYIPGTAATRRDAPLNLRQGQLPSNVLSRVAAGGASPRELEAIVASTVLLNGRAPRHNALGLLKWAAGEHGVSFACLNGEVVAEGLRLQALRPFEFIVNRKDLRFYVRIAGQHRVAGGWSALSSQFGRVEAVDGEWAIHMSTADEVIHLHELLFGRERASEHMAIVSSSPHAEEPRNDGGVEPARDVRVGGEALGLPYVIAQVPPVRAPAQVCFDPDAIDRGNKGHVDTQNAIAEFLRNQGIEPRRPATGEPNYDVGWALHGRLYVAEVKSTTDDNEETQLRLGLGQVLRYRYELARCGKRVIAVLAPERPPTDLGWLELCEELEVLMAWPGELERLLCPPEDAT